MTWAYLDVSQNPLGVVVTCFVISPITSTHILDYYGLCIPEQITVFLLETRYAR